MSSESNVAIQKISSDSKNKTKTQLNSCVDANESCKRNVTLFESKRKIQGKYESSDRIEEVVQKLQDVDERFGQLNNTIDEIKRELSDVFLG